VQACPGSGKTTLVALKLVLLLQNWHDAYSGICVLTHSNVAIDEIMSRVGRDVAGSKLLSYPHFIGTFQDFTNTFLALPYARSREWDVRLTDEADFASAVESATVWNFAVHDRKANKNYVFSTYFKQGKIDPALFSFAHKDGKLCVNPDFMSAVHQLADLKKRNYDEAHFLKLRFQLCKTGVFLYSEMYELAKQATASNCDLLTALRSRFRVTILDEMQDTQKHQDDLLNLVFPGSECAVQRFGDPDQSIFDAMGRGQPNTSYNDAALQCITESHLIF
jgi:DNA helicase-2/ATP-dependent DNA helicase PcrA